MLEALYYSDAELSIYRYLKFNNSDSIGQEQQHNYLFYDQSLAEDEFSCHQWCIQVQQSRFWIFIVRSTLETVRVICV